MISYSETPIQEIQADWTKKAGVKLFIKREDLNHPFASGNKWWKLKYNLKEARKSGLEKLLTFGGAFSNHIIAVAAAAKEMGLESVGIIRGEETLPLNAVLSFAKSQGMALHYFDRDTYRRKAESEVAEGLRRKFGPFYLIPEGGTNSLALKGCAELARALSDIEFDYLCLPVGTGGTMAGLAVGLENKTKLIGFSILKNGSYLNQEIKTMCYDYSGNIFSNWRIETGYHFGGYAKSDVQLLSFIKSFQHNYSLPLEPVYSGKMMFGVVDLMSKGFFDRGSAILVLHTGGLQKIEP